MSELLKELYPKLVANGAKKGVVAIEVEVECLEEANPLIDGWDTDTDGSLRYFGLEFKSRSPVAESALPAHLAKLSDGVKHLKFIENSPRTSVHVHVNVLGLTPGEIWTALTAGWLLEPAMFKLCAKERIGNLFCLRLQDSKAIIDLIEEDVESSLRQTTLPFHYFRNDHYRYANYNINAVTKFGSLEVRGLHGTFDPALIETWARMCIAIVHRSKQFKTPANLLNFLAINGYDAFTKSVLGEDLVPKLPAITNEEFEDQFERVVPMMMVCDWDDFSSTTWKKSKNTPDEPDIIREAVDWRVIADDLGRPQVRINREQDIPMPEDMGEDL